MNIKQKFFQIWFCFDFFFRLLVFDVSAFFYFYSTVNYWTGGLIVYTGVVSILKSLRWSNCLSKMNVWCFIDILTIVWLYSIIGAKSNAEYAEPSRIWFTELFSEAENSFNMEEATDPKCRSDFRQYMSHYRNQTVWAVRSLYPSCFHFFHYLRA